MCAYANIQNPEDKTISRFHHGSRTTVAEASHLASDDPAELRRRISQHFEEALLKDEDIVLIDGRLFPAHTVRFENLQSDLEALNAGLSLGLGDLPARLPKLKMTTRKS